MTGLDVAVVGNCAVASLISASGRHVWFCYPKLDGDPVFSALLGGLEPQAGFMDAEVRGMTRWSQAYRENTAVLETWGEDDTGASLAITDFAPRFERFGRSFHPAMLIRRIAPTKGRPRIRVRIRPHFDHGARVPKVDVGSNHIRYTGSAAALRVTTDMPISYLAEEAEFTLDRPVNLIVGPDEPVAEKPDALVLNFLAETESYWRAWVRGLSTPFDWQDAVIRSAILLKLCSYEDTGAIVAALTTSIPEAPGSSRNWDYRFCWLRDAYFTVGALNRLGATRTMEGFIRFILDAVLRETTADRVVAPLYPIGGAAELTERVATSLAGFENVGPVRVGNAAGEQVQNDAYGSIVLTAAQMFWDRRLSGAGNLALYEQLQAVGRCAVERAFVPDAGPWEYRGRSARHTYSAAMCWAAVHRLSMIAAALDRADEATEWQAHASSLKNQVIKRATTPGGWISGALDAEVADASTLLLTEIGLLAPNDSRVARTLDVVAERLVQDGFVFRYDEADDFGRPETAFLACTFWYSDALALVGRKAEAREYFERAASCRSRLGLLSEHVDVRTRRLWGNIPQTYSHVGLIHAACRLSRGWEEALWRASSPPSIAQR